MNANEEQTAASTRDVPTLAAWLCATPTLQELAAARSHLEHRAAAEPDGAILHFMLGMVLHEIDESKKLPTIS